MVKHDCIHSQSNAYLTQKKRLGKVLAMQAFIVIINSIQNNARSLPFNGDFFLLCTQGEPRRVIFLKELRNTLGFRPFFYLLMLNICSWLGFQVRLKNSGWSFTKGLKTEHYTSKICSLFGIYHHLLKSNWPRGANLSPQTFLLGKGREGIGLERSVPYKLEISGAPHPSFH